jgi:hypothetical protein
MRVKINLYKEIKGNPHHHILHSLTKHGVNKNVSPLFFGVIEDFDVCERETMENLLFLIFNYNNLHYEKTTLFIFNCTYRCL